MAMKKMKTLVINDTAYEVVDEYARNNAGNGGVSTGSVVTEFKFRPITLNDVEKDKYYADYGYGVGASSERVLNKMDLTGHCIFTTDVKKGDSIVFTNSHTLTSTNAKIYLEQNLIIKKAVQFDDIDTEFVFDDDYTLYMSFDYTTVAVGEFFYLKTPSNNEPFVLNEEDATSYESDAEKGDATLKAIMEGRQIVVRIRNAVSGNYTASYSPIYMYQLPNRLNSFLYIFYLKDEKQTLDLSAMGIGTIQLPVYGQLKMKLSRDYNQTPLV